MTARREPLAMLSFLLAVVALQFAPTATGAEPAPRLPGHRNLLNGNHERKTAAERRKNAVDISSVELAVKRKP